MTERWSTSRGLASCFLAAPFYWRPGILIKMWFLFFFLHMKSSNFDNHPSEEHSLEERRAFRRPEAHQADSSAPTHPLVHPRWEWDRHVLSFHALFCHVHFCSRVVPSSSSLSLIPQKTHTGSPSHYRSENTSSPQRFVNFYLLIIIIFFLFFRHFSLFDPSFVPAFPSRCFPRSLHCSVFSFDD